MQCTTGHAKLSNPSTQISKNYSSKYIGVYRDESNETYFSTLTYKKTTHHLGHFKICADAALMYDTCIKCIDSQSVMRVNFSSRVNYDRAKREEMEERGIGIPDSSDITVTINDRVEKFLSRIGKDEDGKETCKASR